MQLFCLTHAGGTAAFYKQLDPYIDNSIEIIKLEYAGHGTRHREAFYQDFDDLAEDMYYQIKRLFDPLQKYAIIGYSMGSISLVETVKKIIALHEMPLPFYVFLAAHEPDSKSELQGYLEEETDEYVKCRTIKFGGVPEQLIQNKSFWRMYLPLYRADYSMISRYKFENLDLKTEIPTTVFYSETDTPFARMRNWKNYFVGKIEFFKFDGMHFFIQQNCQEICSIINQRLKLENR